MTGHAVADAAPPPAVSRRRAKLALFLIATLFCFYRLAIFKPQPLDSPSTLRPLLSSPFARFLESHPLDGPWIWRTCCLAVLIVPPVLAFLNLLAFAPRGRWARRAM